jgi:hypothetical protein
MSLSVRAWIYRLDFFRHVANGEARCLGPRRELLETLDIPRDYRLRWHYYEHAMHLPVLTREISQIA